MTDRSIDPHGAADPSVDANPGGLSMNPAAETDPAAAGSGEPHADKYNDPRATITLRGILLCTAVLVLGILGAAASIYARKTRLGQTTRFWGQETITALQLAEKIVLLPRGSSDFEPVELSGTPGLGHLRRALLDERSFNWQTETSQSVAEQCVQRSSGDAFCVQLRLTDPTAHRFDPVEIDLELDGGWVGPSDGSRRVQVTDWVQPKLRNYFKTIRDVEQMRYDLRQ